MSKSDIKRASKMIDGKLTAEQSLTLIAFLGLKSLIKQEGHKTWGSFCIAHEITDKISREIACGFLALNWAYFELDNDEIKLLEEMYKFIGIHIGFLPEVKSKVLSCN